MSSTDPIPKIGTYIKNNLTFYGAPEKEIEKELPEEWTFYAYDSDQQNFLNFGIYIITQALVQNHIEPEQTPLALRALFKNISETKCETSENCNYSQKQEEFIKSLVNLSNLEEAFKESDNWLKASFYLRAGKAGIRDYETFTAFKETLLMREEDYTALVGSEAQTALDFLSGIKLPSNPIGGLEFYPKYGRPLEKVFFSPSASMTDWTIAFNINMFTGGFIRKYGLQSTNLRAEIGHWAFQIGSSSLSELDDRINIVAYPYKVEEKDVIERYKRYFKKLEELGGEASNPFLSMLKGELKITNSEREELGLNDFFPAVRTFYEGGFYLSTRGKEMPSYPTTPQVPLFGEENIKEASQLENHKKAEWMDTLIRRKVTWLAAKGEIKPGNLRKTCYRVAVYALLLAEEGKSFNEIVYKIYNLNLKEVDFYCKISGQKLIHRSWEILRSKTASFEEKVSAVTRLSGLLKFSPHSKIYQRLYAYLLVANEEELTEGEELKKIGKKAIPALLDAFNSYKNQPEKYFRLGGIDVPSFIMENNLLDESHPQFKEVKAAYLFSKGDYQELYEMGEEYWRPVINRRLKFDKGDWDFSEVPRFFCQNKIKDPEFKKELIEKIKRDEVKSEARSEIVSYLDKVWSDDPEALTAIDQIFKSRKTCIETRALIAGIYLKRENPDVKSDRYQELMAYIYLRDDPKRVVELGEAAKPALRTTLITTKRSGGYGTIETINSTPELLMEIDPRDPEIVELLFKLYKDDSLILDRKNILSALAKAEILKEKIASFLKGIIEDDHEQPQYKQTAAWVLFTIDPGTECDEVLSDFSRGEWEKIYAESPCGKEYLENAFNSNLEFKRKASIATVLLKSEPNRLDLKVYILIKEKKWEEIEKLGKLAVPVLLAMIKNWYPLDSQYLLSQIMDVLVKICLNEGIEEKERIKEILLEKARYSLIDEIISKKATWAYFKLFPN